MHNILKWLKILFFFLFFFFSGQAQAEGSWQIGLKEGTSHAQNLFQWNDPSSSTATGITAVERPVYVDILDPAEIINIHICGGSNSDGLSIDIYDESGTTLLNSTTLTSSNVDCALNLRNII